MTCKYDMFAAATWYARWGWQVLPLRSGSKEPFAGIGVYQATDDLEQVRLWWSEWPDANIGLHCGPSGVLALDVDTYDAAYAGDDLLTLAERRTTTNLTGGGGEHLLYHMPAGERFGCASGQLPSGVHVKGFGGYIVLPPSLHGSGKRYHWEAGYGPHELRPQPLPQKLHTLLQAAQLVEQMDVQFGDKTAIALDLQGWHLSEPIITLIHTPRPRGHRSEADQRVITALVAAGAMDDEIRAVFLNYPIGRDGKYAEQRQHGERYLARSIARARRYVQENSE